MTPLELNWVRAVLINERDKAFEPPLNQTILVFMYVRHDKKKRKTSTPRQLLIADFGFYPKQRELKISFQRKTVKVTVNRHFLLYLRLKGMRKVLQALFVFFFY